MKKLLLVFTTIIGVTIASCSLNSNSNQDEEVLNKCLADTIQLLSLHIGQPTKSVEPILQKQGFVTKTSTTASIRIEKPFIWDNFQFSHAIIFNANDTVLAISCSNTSYTMEQGYKVFENFKNKLYPDSIKLTPQNQTDNLAEIKYFNDKDSINLFLFKTEEVEYIDERWNPHMKDVWEVILLSKKPQQ